MGINTLKTTKIKAIESHNLEFIEPVTTVNITLYEYDSSTKIPLSDIIVSAKNTTSSIGKAITLVTDNDGKVTFELTSGIWEITSKPARADLTPETKIVYAGDYYVTLDKAPKYGGQLTVILLCKGNPVANSSVILSRNKYQDIIGTTNVEGKCLISNVPIGEWQVTSIPNEGYSNPTTTSISVEKDIPTSVTIYQSLLTDTPNPPEFEISNIIGGKKVNWYSVGSEEQNIKYYYTLDGSEPTLASTCAEYIDILEEKTINLKVKAYNVDTNFWSNTSSTNVSVYKATMPNYIVTDILGGKKVSFINSNTSGQIYCGESSTTLTNKNYIDIKYATNDTKLYAQIKNIEGFADSNIFITDYIVVDKASYPNIQILDILGGKEISGVNAESSGTVLIGKTEQVSFVYSLEYKEATNNAKFYAQVVNVIGKVDSDIHCYQDIIIPKCLNPLITKSINDRVLTITYDVEYTLQYGWYGSLNTVASQSTNYVTHTNISDDNGTIIAKTYKIGYADSDTIEQSWNYIAFIGQFVSIGTNDAWNNTTGVEWVQANEGISPHSTHTNKSYLERITTNNKRVVTTGLYGESFYSVYGDYWIYMSGLSDFSTEKSVAIDYPFVAYGNDKFITISNDGISTTPSILYKSLEGTEWVSTSVSIGNDTNIVGGDFVNDRFIIFGTKGKSYYSYTGENWAILDGLNKDNITFFRVCYGNNRYVACGNNGAIATSTDGLSWTIRYPLNTTSTYKGIAYGEGKFVIVSTEGEICYSIDGINWTTVLQTDNILTSISYGYNRFMVSGYNCSYSSYDGENWVSLTLGFNSENNVYTTNRRN